MNNVIIIGNGPAGVSASLYTKRAGVETTIIGRDGGVLSKADKIENYYGFESPISGDELLKKGYAQANRLGVEMINDEVIGISYDGNFVVKTTSSEYKAKCVILATGSQRKIPKIEGFTNFEGKGISYCAVCDAFFYRGKAVGVLGAKKYALSEAKELLPIASEVTIFTDGNETELEIPSDIKVDKRKIAKISGENKLEQLVFEDGDTQNLDGLFVAMGVASSSDLARKLGVVLNGNNIAVDQNMATNIPGLYAAGDCTGGMLQINKAVYEGAKAGGEVAKLIRKSNN